MFKLRYYYLTGINKGNVKYEEYFKTLAALDKKIKKVYEYGLGSLNPTAWKDDTRITNY